MSLTAVLLVLTAALCHAGWNLASKRSSSAGIVFIWWGAIFQTLFYLPVAAVDIVSNGVDLRSLVLGAGISAVFHVAYMWLLQRGYAVADLSVVYPLARGTGPTLTVIFALILFGERPGAFALIGAAVIIAGIVIIGWPRSSSLARRDPRIVRAGVFFGLMTGVAIAGYTLWDAFSVNGLGVNPVPLMVGCTLGEVVLLLPLIWRRRAGALRVLRENLRPAVIIGIFSPLSYILVLTAMTIAPVALVAPMREVSVVLISLMGWLILHEEHPVQRVSGSIVVLGGVAMLALGG